MYSFDEAKTRWFMSHVLPHEPVLRGWLARRSGVAVDVDDIVQETYAVLAARQTIDDIRHPRAYLFQIAHSIIVKHVRRAKVVSIQAAEDLEAFNPADEAASPEQTVIDRDELRGLATAIAEMPGRTREAFILRRIHGLSQREIASRMKLSESTVEKHIARGVRFLIDWFGHGGKGRPEASRAMEPEFEASHGRTRDQSEH